MSGGRSPRVKGDRAADPVLAEHAAEIRRLAIRTSETFDALADIMVTMLAMVPAMDVPSELRKTAKGLAKRIRVEVARGRAEGVADRLGARKGGTA